MNGKQMISLQNIKSSQAFSLMELLVVLVILGLLAAAVGPTLYKRINPAKQTAARDQMQSFLTALDSYFIDVGRYPSSQQGLLALRKKPEGTKNWDGPYLKKEIPNDPWDNAYKYQAPGRNGGYEIISFGADGVEGGEEVNHDIASWESE